MARKAAQPTMTVQVSQADLARFRREFTKLSYEFPRESGRAARSLGSFVMKGMRQGLRKGRVNNKLVRFGGGWQRLNPLYKLMRKLSSGREPDGYGGKLSGAWGALGPSPIGYFYDEQGLSVSVGMFRSTPNSSSYKRKRSSGVVISEGAAKSFERFQRGQSKAVDSELRHRTYQQLARAGASAGEIAMARREMHKGWNSPERRMVDPMATANMGAWLAFLGSRVKWIVENKAKGGK